MFSANSDYDVGMELFQEKRTKESLPYLLRALEAQSAELNYWTSLGDAFLVLRRPLNALYAFDKGFSNFPKDLGCAARRNELKQKVLQASTKKLQGQELMEEGRFLEALQCVNQASEFAPILEDVMTLKMAVLGDMGEIAQAAEVGDEAVALYPESMLAHILRGQQYLDVKEPELAQDEFLIAIGLDGKQSVSHVGLAFALLELGDLSAAKRECDLAASLNPSTGSGLDKLGTLLHKCGRNREALLAYDRAISLGTYLPCITFISKGIVHESLNDPEEAIRCYLSAGEQIPSCGLAFYNLSRLFFKRLSKTSFDDSIRAEAYLLRGFYIDNYAQSVQSALHPASKLQLLRNHIWRPLLARRLLLKFVSDYCTLGFDSFWNETNGQCAVPDYLIQRVASLGAIPDANHKAILQAKILFHYGDPFTALERFKHVLQRDGINLCAWYYVCQCLTSFIQPCDSELRNAMTIARRVGRESSEASEDQVYYAGLILLLNGDNAAAAQTFRRNFPELKALYMAWFTERVRDGDAASSLYRQIEAAESIACKSGRGFTSPPAFPEIPADDDSWVGCIDMLCGFYEIRQAVMAFSAYHRTPEIFDFYDKQRLLWKLNREAAARLDRMKRDTAATALERIKRQHIEHLRALPHGVEQLYNEPLKVATIIGEVIASEKRGATKHAWEVTIPLLFLSDALISDDVVLLFAYRRFKEERGRTRSAIRSSASTFAKLAPPLARLLELDPRVELCLRFLQPVAEWLINYSLTDKEPFPSYSAFKEQFFKYMQESHPNGFPYKGWIGVIDEMEELVSRRGISH